MASESDIEIHDCPLCVVCGFPDSVVKLVWLTWQGDYDILGEEPQLAVVTIPKADDVSMCTTCICGVKRLRFSDIARACGAEA